MGGWGRTAPQGPWPGRPCHPPPHLHLFPRIWRVSWRLWLRFAYTGRTAQELTFQRGDILRLHEPGPGDRVAASMRVRGPSHKYITLPVG